MLATGFLVLGLVSTSRSLGYALRGADIDRAAALSPGDARLTALRALKLAQPASSAAVRTRAEGLARMSLRRDPTAVPAVNALAVLALLDGRERQGRSLFGYAMRLSRRDLPSQLWAIEDAVARNDVRGALHHYDIALRASGRAADLLFPVLAQAIAEQPVRSALVDTMAARPLWSEAFISHAADKGPDFIAAAGLFTEVGRRGVVVPPYARTALIGRLLERGRYGAAWAYYAAVTPGADRLRSRDGGFGALPVSPTAFDWNTVADAGVSASIQAGDGGGLLAFSAAPSVGGPLARQLQVLPPGRYTLSGRSADIDQARGSWPYWSLTCLGGAEIGTVEVPASTIDGGRFRGELTVPADCPAQWLTLVARASDGTQGLQGVIRGVRLRPVGEPSPSPRRAIVDAADA